ncbi:sigma-54-dependent Fis family transcriptional regulator [uncultured Thiothrix sp.]|uniref:sigma-54 interaction domain-containing protein n=1 Tax=uncultured Thiothrix sp. TaxID=223185 RepID=UPI002613A919|nr:sigma-54 dependent transcriptional regulator [uncultured Thiothrix sp.]
MYFDAILTRSATMQALLCAARLVASTQVTVLITGESGTGKELVAKAIHHSSTRKTQAFITVNCAALPETLAESLLFGHRKGSFTGAEQAQIGLIAAAEGGTLFLDEIGELPLTLQAKLLRFLESGEILPLGELRARQVDVRVLAATHRNLEQESRAGQFRSDLFYRLNVMPLELLPLRERPEDIEVLSQHFLSHFAEQHGLAKTSLARDALKTLQRYAWPGNVRELKNTCERLSILLAGQRITSANLPTQIQQTKPTSLSAFVLPADGVNLEALERDLLQQALDKAQHNKTQAARLLGISRDALNYRLKKYWLA